MVAVDDDHAAEAAAPAAAAAASDGIRRHDAKRAKHSADDAEAGSASDVVLGTGGPAHTSAASVTSSFPERLVRALEAGDAASLEAVVHPQAIWHDSLAPYQRLQGPAGAYAALAVIRRAFPSDLKVQFVGPLEAGQDGLLLGYWHAHGTHTGPLHDTVPPNDAHACWEGSLLVRAGHAAAASGTAAASASADGGGGDATAPVGCKRRASGSDDAAAGSNGAPGEDDLLALELWWSWDPLLLYKQLGWQAKSASSQVLEEGQRDEDRSGTAPGEDLRPATESAAAAAATYASEGAAVEAARAAVEAAAQAEARGASAEERWRANRAIVELYFHVYNTGHYAVLDHIVHPEYHYAGLLDLGGKRGRAGMETMMRGWRDAVPALCIGHELFGAVGEDKVVFRWVIQGTHQGPANLLGVEPSGKKLLVKGVTCLTIQDGRIVRKVSHANGAHTLLQLGVAANAPTFCLLPAAGAAAELPKVALAAATEQ